VTRNTRCGGHRFSPSAGYCMPDGTNHAGGYQKQSAR
jgi:hypothetical protein